MKAAELRRKYIEFFNKHGHVEIKSAPVVPENDPTCLFTTAGMHPLVPYLSGAAHPAARRPARACRSAAPKQARQKDRCAPAEMHRELSAAPPAPHRAPKAAARRGRQKGNRGIFSPP